MEKNAETSLVKLYSTLNEEELGRAKETVEQYLSLVLRIYERILADPEEYAKFRTLTAGTGTLGCTPPGSGQSSESKLQTT
jgi:hypothetical protein